MVQSKNMSSKSKGKTSLQHVFRNVREPVMDNTLTNSVTTMVVAANSSTAVTARCLSPIGVSAPGLTVSGTNVVVGTTAQAYVVNPSLKWLANTAINFGSYRVTRATLVFVGSVGTTFTGQLIVAGFRDVMDANAVPQVAFAVGRGARVFDIASSGTKELKVSLPVDTSWKKVSAIMSVAGSISPFVGGTYQLINVNTVNDLCFGAFSAQVVGAPLLSTATTVGSFFLDYDVEFKEPESLLLNL